MRAEEARLRVEEATRKRAEEEAARKRAEEEAARKRAEEEAARKRAEEEARLRAEKEAAQRRAEEEEALRRIEEDARKRAEDEMARQRAEEEAIRLAQEVEEVKRRAEEARQQAEEEALRRAKEESARKRAEAKAEELERKFEEAQRRAEEARARAEEEARINDEKEAARQRIEEENARKRAEEAARKRAEEAAARKHAEEEADRFAREIASAQRNAEEARLRAEEEAYKRAGEEAARRRAEDEARRLTLKVEEATRRSEEVRRQAEEEVQRKALEEAQHLSAEASRRIEASRRVEESEHQYEPNETRPLETPQPTGEEATRDFKQGEINETRSLEEPTELISTLYTPPPVPFNAGAASKLQSQDSSPGLVSGSDQSRAISAREQPAPPVQDYGAQPADVPRRKNVLPRIFIAASVLLLMGLTGYFLYRMLHHEEPPRVGERNENSSTVKLPPAAGPQAAASQADMIMMNGGTFKMGLDNIVPTPDNDKQKPAHTVTLKKFLIDRTEVTNAEYADFVHATNYPPPKGWSRSNPPAGQERWPVTSVNLDDARAFAAWRSRRDHVTYRLPTEEEWEYAARGGTRGYLYPWGNAWSDDRANLGTGAGKDVDFPKPVGSYPQGATPDGVLDMIGNVWEWTSSRASYYSGNDSQLITEERGYMVIRGGSHQSLYSTDVIKRGGKEFPATFRLWVKGDRREGTLGFRLVRDAAEQ
jgi:formylglycine-generating enzyme required for sulfatase activity